MDIHYIPGTGADFVAFIQGLGDKAQLKVIDGNFRWVVIEDDGTEYIARPQSAQDHE